MTKLMARFIREEAGQDLIEYGLLIGIVTVVTVGVIRGIGTDVKKFFDDVKAELEK